MPYTGADDPDLPEHVKKMDDEARKKWVATWNSVYNKDHDEGKAFRVANGTAKESLIRWSRRPW